MRLCMKQLLCLLLISTSLLDARNPFRYETLHNEEVVVERSCCVGEGMCGDEQLRLIRTQDGELRVIKEKVPSTLGKAEGLGG